MKYRIEKDVLGSIKVPADAYYGSETQRSLNNFTASGTRVPLEIIYAYAILKKSAALANMRNKKLDPKKASAIVRACNEILSSKHDDQFILDVFQAGAGTSTNMNLNEVIANRANEMLGGKKGDYKLVHPNDHVNMSQSTNDTSPSVVHIAVYLAINRKLLPSLLHLEKSLERKSSEFSKITKVGRTHLEDAVPITLGQEFSGYFWAVRNTKEMIIDAQRRLLDLPLGGTAVGTGINADEKYSRYAVEQIGKFTGVKFRIGKNRYVLMQQRLEELAVADALKQAATAINKISNDIRLLNSGPRTGLGDIIIPEIMPGSSIMPGKINPSIPEMVNMVCQKVIGNCTTVTEAANGGQLEINVFTPLIGYDLISSINILSNASVILADKCISGTKANKAGILDKLEMNLSLATALNPYIGYEKASQIARKAYRENKSIRQVCMEMKVMDKKKLDKILNTKR